jgi:choline kinase
MGRPCGISSVRAQAGRSTFASVTGAPWIEFDFSEDIARAERQILPELQSLPGVTP